MPATSHGSAKLETWSYDKLLLASDHFPKHGGNGFDLGTNTTWDAPAPPVWVTPSPEASQSSTPTPLATPAKPVSAPAVKMVQAPLSPARNTGSTVLGIAAALFFVFYLFDTTVGARLLFALILGGIALWLRFSKRAMIPKVLSAVEQADQSRAAFQEKQDEWKARDDAFEAKQKEWAAGHEAFTASFRDNPQMGVTWNPGFRKGMGITFGSAQSGKGISTIIPALLTYYGPIFTLDIKAEQAAITAQRRRDMGCKVDIVDPFGEVNRIYGKRGGWTEKITKYNPLAALDPKAITFSDDVAAMGEAIFVDQGGGENSSFFNGASRELGVGVMAAVVLQRDDTRTDNPGPGTFREVRKLLSLNSEKFAAVCKGICELFPNSLASAKLERFTIASKTNDAIQFTAWEQTKFLDSEELLRSMEPEPGEPVFTFDSLATRIPAQTVYVVIPPTHIVTHARYLRLLVMQAMRAVLRARYQEKDPIAFLLDEAGTALGHLSVVEQAYGLTAGLGVTVWSFYQDIGQLRRDYPQSYGTFIGNSSMVQIVAARDKETCEYFSQYLGNSTEPAEGSTRSETRSSTSGNSSGSSFGASSNTSGGSSNTGSNTGWSSGASEGLSTTTSHTPMSRPLKYPDEIRNMDPRNLLVCFAGDKQYEVKKIAYYKDPRYAGLFRPDPTKPGFVKPTVAANDDETGDIPAEEKTRRQTV